MADKLTTEDKALLFAKMYGKSEDDFALPPTYNVVTVPGMQVIVNDEVTDVLTKMATEAASSAIHEVAAVHASLSSFLAGMKAPPEWSSDHVARFKGKMTRVLLAAKSPEYGDTLSAAAAHVTHKCVALASGEQGVDALHEYMNVLDGAAEGAANAPATSEHVRVATAVEAETAHAFMAAHADALFGAGPWPELKFSQGLTKADMDAAVKKLSEPKMPYVGTPMSKSMYNALDEYGFAESKELSATDVMPLLREAFPGIESPAWRDWRKAVCPARGTHLCKIATTPAQAYVMMTVGGENRRVTVDFDDWMRDDDRFTVSQDDMVHAMLRSDRFTVAAMVQHLNDHHEWTYEQIADWLDTLDTDLTKKEKDA